MIGAVQTDAVSMRDAIIEVCKVNNIPHEPVAAALDEGMETDPIHYMTFSKTYPRRAAIRIARRFIAIGLLPDYVFRQVRDGIDKEQKHQAKLN